MLFRRSAYDAVGGHAAVNEALLEDLALARLVGRHRRSAGVFLAAGLLHCRMYGDWAHFRGGWKRIYTEAANRNAARLYRLALRVRFLGTVLPLWTLGCGLYGLLLAFRDIRTGWSLLGFWLVATLAWLGALLRVASVAQAPPWTAPLHVIGAWLTGSILKEAADDLRSQRPMQWGGREYDLGVKKAVSAGPIGDSKPTAQSP
jgi:hypothetical protein